MMRPEADWCNIRATLGYKMVAAKAHYPKQDCVAQDRGQDQPGEFGQAVVPEPVAPAFDGR